MSTMEMMRSTESYWIQKTIAEAIPLAGIGLHTGAECKMRLCPAEPNAGVYFQRVDLKDSVRIPAHFDSVVGTEMATTLGVPGDPRQNVSTVEHVLAATYALGISNLRIEVTGPEVPILDGSARPFVEAILGAGVVPQAFKARVLRIRKPIRIYQKGAVCELLPRNSLRLTTSVDFTHPCIGLQTFAVELTPQIFAEQIAGARTFGFVSDIDRLREKNLALGASLENVLGFSDEAILNPEGSRFQDECVRHKLLDAIGDLSLCGGWIAGEMVSFRGGHSMHLALLKALQSQPSSWEWTLPEPLYVPRTQGVVEPAASRETVETFLSTLN